MRRFALALLGFAAPLIMAASANAATVTERLPLFSFDGSDSDAGAFKGARKLAVDQSSGDVYVLDTARGVIDRFDPSGKAKDFAPIASSSLGGAGTPQGTLGLSSDSALAVDHSPVNPGRVYVTGNEGRLNAFAAGGEYLWQRPPDQSGFSFCGLAVDLEGHLWASSRVTKTVFEFAASGSPPEQISSFTPTAKPCGLDLDASGGVYLMREQPGSTYRIEKYAGGAFASILDPEASLGLSVDQSSLAGHVFVLHDKGDFNEYDSSGALVGTFGAGRLPGNGTAIGYAPALDRVYVSTYPGTVTVFGPKITGTAPDASIEASNEVGVAKATFHGKINPQSVPNAYFFEWKPAEAGWPEGAKRSAPQSLPEDSSEHPVQLVANTLRGNTTYQVRLVGENTANGLRTISATDTFKTTKALSPPALTIAPSSAITPSAATVTGTIDPEGDTADWRVQLSTDASCAKGFASQAQQTIQEGSEAPVGVQYELSGLLPSQHYCVRISATNSAGTTTSETKQFETDPVIPSQVTTAFASPRLDTAARLNARVNPEGEVLTYRFEYSKDGGKSWIELPEREETSQAREQIVVGEELAGLSPNSSYRFRFSAENKAGQASPQGLEKSFTTRTGAEVADPARGMELVNTPDKGNRNVLSRLEAGSPMSADGDAVIWYVSKRITSNIDGADGAFLAERSAGGWASRNLIPPASERIGRPGEPYGIENATPDLRHFLFKVEITPAGGRGQTLIRLDREGHQEVLDTSTQSAFAPGEKGEMSKDGAHVLTIDPDTDQLRDIDEAQPEIVSLMPAGTPSACGLTPSGESFAGPGGGGAGNNWHPGYRMMDTEDATFVYFETRADGECDGRYGLYLRDREAQETTLVDLGTGHDSEFIRSTADGEHAYFVSFSQLDPQDKNNGRDVYRFDVGSGESTCLTCVVANANLASLSPAMVSDDFSHIYFQSKEQLVPGEGSAGQVNTYVLSEGKIDFLGVGVASLDYESAVLSADGNVLLFRNSEGVTATLSANDLAAKCLPPPGLGENLSSCKELYLYDDRDGSIECISCSHTGQTKYNSGNAYTDFSGDFRLSADGSTASFVTVQALIPQDVNQAVDVYEWHQGAIHLVSDGESAFQEGTSSPQVRAVSEDGRSILFILADPGLTGFEQDGLTNLYVARIGGGFQAPEEAAPCVEDACQGPLLAPPPLYPAASAAFSGRGNVETRRSRGRCAKGKVRRQRRRCAKGHKHRRHRPHRAKQGRHRR